MIHQTIPYDPIAWGQRITAATHQRDFDVLVRDAQHGYAVAVAATQATPGPEATSAKNHWAALLTMVKMRRDLRFPVTYSVTTYDSPRDLHQQLGHY